MDMIEIKPRTPAIQAGCNQTILLSLISLSQPILWYIILVVYTLIGQLWRGDNKKNIFADMSAKRGEGLVSSLFATNMRKRCRMYFGRICFYFGFFLQNRTFKTILNLQKNNFKQRFFLVSANNRICCKGGEELCDISTIFYTIFLLTPSLS